MTLHRAPAAHQLDDDCGVIFYWDISVCFTLCSCCIFSSLWLKPLGHSLLKRQSGLQDEKQNYLKLVSVSSFSLQQEQKHVSSLQPGSLSNDILKCFPSSKPHRGSWSGLNWFEEIHCYLFSSVHDVRFLFFLCGFPTCPVFTFPSTPTLAVSLWYNLNLYRSQVDLSLGN